MIAEGNMTYVTSCCLMDGNSCCKYRRQCKGPVSSLNAFLYCFKTEVKRKTVIANCGKLHNLYISVTTTTT